MKKILKPGKLEHGFLQKLIAKLPRFNKDIIIPPGLGLDAAGLKIGNNLVAITTDPITFSSNKIATYSIAINLNDIICLGCKPKWYLSCLLLPLGTTKQAISDIWQNLSYELKRYDIQAIGGHIEITSKVSSPIIVGQMIGEVIGKNFLSPKNSRPGDQILLYNAIAIEGTALLATNHYKSLQKYLSIKELKSMQKLLDKPGISLWPLIKKLLPCKGLIAIHDITEGGIATALHELADASALGLRINKNAIAIRTETKKLAQILNFDPLGLIASGSAILITRKKFTKKIIETMGTDNLQLIGELTRNKQRLIVSSNTKRPIPRFTSDEFLTTNNLSYG